MKIVHFPHIALVKKSLEVTDFNSELQEFCYNMIEVMKASEGVGLAANQVAKNQRIFVMQCDESQEPFIFINPEILELSENKQINQEGCLSFPQLQLDIERSQSISIRWQNLQREYQENTFTGLEAICIQHEIEHLNGINFIDKLGKVKKIMALKKYNKKSML